jgi:hypothetical protein
MWFQQMPTYGEHEEMPGLVAADFDIDEDSEEDCVEG